MPAGRAPFDDLDAERAGAYARGRGLAVVDPSAGPKETDDLLFRTSLSGARSVMEQCFRTARADGQAFRAYPFIVGRPSTNAFADEHAGLQLCGLDVGLGNTAFEIGLFVFSQASLFREVGDADAERSQYLPAGSQLAFLIDDQLRQRDTTDGPPVGMELIPKDGGRRDGANALAQLMLRFVWLHELYHCLNGHTGLMSSQDPGIALNEMPGEDAVDLVDLEPKEKAARHERLRHAMEYDADRSALWMLVRMQQVGFEPIEALSAWPKPLRLKLAIFAAVLMTFVFDQAARRQARRNAATHPRAQYRLLDLVRTLASHLVEPSGEVKQAFSAVLVEMTGLQARVPGFISAARLLDDLRSVPLQRELDEVDEALTAARASFAPFAYR